MVNSWQQIMNIYLTITLHLHCYLKPFCYFIDLFWLFNLCMPDLAAILNLRFICSYTDWPVGGGVRDDRNVQRVCNFLYILHCSMIETGVQKPCGHVWAGSTPAWDWPLPWSDLLLKLCAGRLVDLSGWMEGWMEKSSTNLGLSFQIWCSKARPEQLISSVNSDTHSQGIFR